MKKYVYSIIFAFSLSISTYATECSWSTADSIVTIVERPSFPNRKISIRRFGAVPDGKTMCTTAFQQAIETCHAKGGGHVIVPKGIWLTGAIHLLSNVDLHLEKGAEIRFSRNDHDFLPVVHTRFGGEELMNYSPFVYAYQQQNIAITGEGTLNGQANDTTWWNWNGWGKGPKLQSAATKRLHKQAQKAVPVEQRIYGEGCYIRPNFIQPYGCSRVLIQGVTLIQSPAWIIHPVNCDHLTIDGITINSIGPNNDGIDPESCDGVVIQNCRVRSGDDCIAIKAGKDHDGRSMARPCRNLVVRNCYFVDGHCAIGVGSEMSAGVENIFVENCVMNSQHLDRAIRLKTNSQRGGFIRNIYVKNCQVEKTRGALLDVDMFYYDDQRKGKYYTQISNIILDSILCQHLDRRLFINGSDSIPVRHIVLRNCDFHSVNRSDQVCGAEDIQIYNDSSLWTQASFLIGAALSSKQMSDPMYQQVALDNFSSFASIGALKMRTIWRDSATYDFAEADAFVDFALAHGKQVHGHTLLWGKVPDWLNQINDSARLEDLLREYITTVVSRYKGRIASWDVANEMIDDEGNLKAHNFWISRLGEDCLARAFKYAHKADPECLLFYNDYGQEYSNKRRDGIIQLVNSWRKRYIPIHGVGLQMHTRIGQQPQRWWDAIHVTAQQTGLKIHVSELDVALNRQANKDFIITDSIAHLQRMAYETITEAYCALPDSQQYRLAVWDMCDKYSWVKSKKKCPDYPTLFDDTLHVKPAYWGMYDALKHNHEWLHIRPGSTLPKKYLIGHQSPSLYMFHPSKPNGTSIIICPGGGYARLNMRMAKMFADPFLEWGITPIVVAYRLPINMVDTDKIMAPVVDGQLALQWVRQHADSLGLDPNKVGVLGSSAGGHVASAMCCSDSMQVVYGHTDWQQPNFAILCWSVTNFSISAGGGTESRMFPDGANDEIRYLYSPQRYITAATPPTFLVHAEDDKSVNYRCSIAYYERMQQLGIPSYLYLSLNGGHGFGFETDAPNYWFNSLKEWLKFNHFI